MKTEIITTFTFSGLSNFVCPAKARAMQMLEKGEQVTTVLTASPEGTGFFPVYIEEIKPENKFGLIQKLADKDGAAADATDMQVIVGEKYEVIELQINGNNLSGTINVVRETSADTKSSKQTSSELDQLIAEKVKDGIVSKKEADERIKVMRDNYVGDNIVKWAVTRWKKYAKPTHKPSCIYVDPYIEESRKALMQGKIEEGMQMALKGDAVIYEGDKSVGKNVFAETIAWLLGMPMYLITFSRQMSPSAVYGEKSTDNSASEKIRDFDTTILKKADDIRAKRDALLKAMAEACQTSGIQFDETEFVKKFVSEEENRILEQAQEFEQLKAQAASVNIVIDASELYDWLTIGGAMVFNEMNMAEPNFLASFTNQLLDGTGFLFIPGRGEVKINPDCVLIGTQNADYEGTEQQNEATMSRFNAFVFQQPKTIKPQLVAAVTAALKKCGYPDTTVSPDLYKQAEGFYKKCNAAVTKGTITNACLNIRGFVRAISNTVVSGGRMKLRRAIECCVVNTCPVDERDVINSMLLETVSI